MKKADVSYLLKCSTVFCAFFGVILSLLSARADGYSHWAKRLLYFTAQSNIFTGLIFLALVFLPLCNTPKKKRRVYLLKYLCTVSITITCLIFCALLAPFCDESYHPWTLPNVLTHVVTPLLVIVDFFLDEYPLNLTFKHVCLCLTPPLLYLLLVATLSALHTDFGRGVPYPYFFLHYRSPAGIFGFSNVSPFFIGSFYWIVLFTLFVLGFAALYAAVYNARGKKIARLHANG